MREPRTGTLVTRASLINRLKNWDDKTNWQEFDRSYRRLIIAFALKQGLREPEAQDVAQETLVAVAKDIGKFKYDPARSSFKTWLLTVTRHRIADYCRRRSKEVDLRPLPPGETSRTSTVARVPDPSSEDINAVWEEEWRRTLTEQAMELLKTEVNTEHFQIFYLSVIKQKSSANVAKALGVNMGKVYLVRHRLAQRFRKIVEALRNGVG